VSLLACIVTSINSSRSGCGRFIVCFIDWL